MSCANDSGWEDEGQKTNIVNIHECVLWSHLLQLRNLYNLVRDKCAEYGIELELPIGRPKYGEPGYSEELEPLATIEGFISIKLTPGANPQFQETRFIITGGTINERIPAPNSSYNYNDGDYGPWIVYLKSDCYGCGGWRLDRAGNHYPRYRCCNGNSCADMDPASWKSQNYVGRTTEGGICHFGREWGNNYMDVINHCIAISNPKNPCVCDYFPPCSRTVLECCDIDAKFHYSNWYDVLGPTGGAYGNPNCAVSAEICPENAEKRGIKWIGSHEPTSGYRGYVTQVIKAKHLNDIYTAITPALTGGHRMGGDWLYCKDRQDKKWGRFDSVNLDTFRYRFDKCQQCEKPVTSDNICACHMNDLSYVLNKMLGNTCECLGSDDAYKGQQMWKIVTGGTPTSKQCFCGGPCVGGYCETLEDGFNFPSSVSASITYTPPDLSWIMSYPQVCSGSTVAESQGCSVGGYIPTECGDANFDVSVTRDENGNCFLSLFVSASPWPAAFGAGGTINGLGTYTFSGDWSIQTFCADCDWPYYTEPGSVTISLG